MIATPRAYVRPPWSASRCYRTLSEAGTSRNYRKSKHRLFGEICRGGADETVGRTREYNRVRNGKYCEANIFREIRHAFRRDQRKFVIFEIMVIEKKISLALRS